MSVCISINKSVLKLFMHASHTPGNTDNIYFLLTVSVKNKNTDIPTDITVIAIVTVKQTHIRTSFFQIGALLRHITVEIHPR